jgi:glycosyl hydrolase family 20, catalytic domain protein
MHLLSRCSAALLCCLLALPVVAQSPSDSSAPVEAYTLDLSQGRATTSQVRLLPAELKAGLKILVLTGTLSSDRNGDFRQIRDLCPNVEVLDLSAATCTEIPDNAFLGHRGLRKVVLPQGVKRIGRQAFFHCKNLQEIVLPSTVTIVEDGAFNGCTALRKFDTSRATLQRVGFAAFEGVPSAHLPQPTFDLWAKAATEKYSLIPYPAQLEVLKGKPLMINKIGKIEAAPELANEAAHASRILRNRSGLNVLRGCAKVQLLLDATVQNAEGYELTANKKGIVIKGSTPAGVFYGLTTLEQLLTAQPQMLEPVKIVDAPRTRVRELMVDPVRTFIPFAELKRMVTEMARYKYNALHLHLVDDQAWRIEIKKYPRLVAESSMRPAMDDMLYTSRGFYTQDEMRELVDFAAQHHIMVIPEIEMPGHEVAAIHAYPQLTVGNKKVPVRTTSGVSNNLLNPASEFTYQFLFDVFDELAKVFPAPYVHLGGDEAGNPPLDDWTTDSACIALKEKLGITTRDRSENWKLQKYMFDRVIAHLRDKLGKTPMFWYETDFKEIQPGCITFAWRNGLTKTAIDAARANKAKIMLCPGEHCYFDYPMDRGDLPEVNWGMPVTSLKRVYDLDPAWGQGDEFERNYLFGVTGTLWSECMPQPERIYYQAFPRAMALAEVGWTPQARRNYDHFLRRLQLVQADQLRRGYPSSSRYAGYDLLRKEVAPASSK